MTLKERARRSSLLDPSRFSTLEKAIRSTATIPGEIWECGAFKGGTGLYMRAFCIEIGIEKPVRLFDTFVGMPFSSKHDKHSVGTFSDTNYDSVLKLIEGVDNISLHKGQMPDSFTGLEDQKIVVAHIDVDNYDSVAACLNFCYDRMPIGGYVVIDDYNCSSCPGAKLAVDDFCAKYNINLIAPGIPNPQAYFIKS